MYDEVGAPLRFWFGACFGFSVAASAVAISLKLHLLVRTVRARQEEVVARSKANALEERLDEVRLEIRALYCYILLTVFEDVPLGSLNLAYLRLILVNPTNVKAQSTTGAILTVATFSSTFFIIGYNLRQLLGLPDAWTRQQTLNESVAVLERVRIVFEKHSLACAVRQWRAVSSVQVLLRACQPNDAATSDGASKLEVTTNRIRTGSEIAIDDANSEGCEQGESMATEDNNVFRQMEVASDAADGDRGMKADKTASDTADAVPSHLAGKRSSLSVVWDDALSRAIVSIERHEDARATERNLGTQIDNLGTQIDNLGTQIGAQQQQGALQSTHPMPGAGEPPDLGLSTKPRYTSGSRSTLMLQWDERSNEAMVSISRLDNTALPVARASLEQLPTALKGKDSTLQPLDSRRALQTFSEARGGEMYSDAYHSEHASKARGGEMYSDAYHPEHAPPRQHASLCLPLALAAHSEGTSSLFSRMVLPATLRNIPVIGSTQAHRTPQKWGDNSLLPEPELETISNMLRLVDVQRAADELAWI
jgi:hypothetical protein